MFRTSSFLKLFSQNLQVISKNTRSFSTAKSTVKDPYKAISTAMQKHAGNEKNLEALIQIKAALDGNEKLTVALIDKATELAPDSAQAMWDLFKEYTLHQRQSGYSKSSQS